MPYTLVLDPGHGGEDKGTEHHGLIESTYVLEFCELLSSAIAGSGMPFDVRLTRVDDVGLSLRERGGYSAQCKADLVLPIHVNALASSPETRGMTLFHWPGNKLGLEVAGQIARAAPADFRKHKPVRSAEPDEQWLRRVRNVLSPHRATSVLVELGFATNEAEALSMQTEGHRWALVCAVMAGLARFLEKVEASPLAARVAPPADLGGA